MLCFAVNPHLQGGYALRSMSTLTRFPMDLKELLYPATLNAILGEEELMTLVTAAVLAAATSCTETMATLVDFLYSPKSQTGRK